MANEKKIKIVVDKSGAQRALNQVNEQLGKVGLQAEGLNTNMLALKGGVGAIAGVVAGVGAAAVAVTAFSASVAASVTNLDNLSTRANVSIQTFQTWSAAANKLGVDNEMLSQTFQDVADRLGEFIRTGGQGEFSDIYDQYIKPLGIAIEDLRNMRPDEVLNLVKKGMLEAGASTSEIISGLEQIASNASYLNPILDGTGAKIDRLKDAMQRDGKLVDDEDVTKARELDAQAKELGKTWESLKTNVGLLVAGPATDFLSFLDSAITKTQQLAKDSADAASKLAKFLSTDAQLKNIELMKTLSGQESIEGGQPVNRTDILGQFSYKTKPIKTVKDIDEDKKDEEKNNRELERMQEQFEQKQKIADQWLLYLQQRNMDEFDLLDSQQEQELTKLQEQYDAKLIQLDEYESAKSEIEQTYADKHYELMQRTAEQEAKIDKQKAKEKAQMDKMIKAGNMSVANEALSLIEMTAKDGSAIQVAAFIAQKALAINEALVNTEVAATKALAIDPTGTLAASVRTQGYASVALIGAQAVASMFSRQGGGAMSGTYQIGGGAHTSTPELFTDSRTGKSYLTGDGFMTPTHQLKSGSNQSSGFNLTVNNLGEPATVSVQDNGMDENGVRQLILEMTPDIMNSQAGDPSSQFNQTRQTIERIQPEFN
ncbi:MAG: hypothetical protein ACPGUE_11215 [Marinomonas sp.]